MKCICTKIVLHSPVILLSSHFLCASIFLKSETDFVFIRAKTVILAMFVCLHALPQTIHQIQPC